MMVRVVRVILATACIAHALQTPTTRIVKHSGVRATPVVDAEAPPPAADMSDASAAALIAGTTVGAGVLALPAATAGAGFAASTGVLCGSWVFMAAAGLLVADCVEINQCVGCTRQFFTKLFLGDGAAILARSSGEEPAPPRHRAGVASMAWRSTRRISTNAP